MKKLLLPLMISLTLLCGCADTAQERFISFMESVNECSRISFTADVRAEYSDKTAEFTLTYSQDGDDAVVEVIKPDIIAGIKARVNKDGAAVEYDGAVLDIGSLTDEGLSPVSALPLLASAIKNSHIELSWTESDMLAARLIPNDDTTVTLWLDGEQKPVSAELGYKEKTLVFITIHDWEMS